MSRPDIDRVADLIREVAHQEILARFRSLGESDIFAKPSKNDPDDVVTAADRAAERRLTERLRAMHPGWLIVGEEAAAREPDLVARSYGAEQVLYIDPLDGTKNFAEGYEDFGVMLAFVERHDPVAMWIYLPTTDVMLTAEMGSGAYANGSRLPEAGAAPESGWTGTLNVRHLPERYRDAVPSWYGRLERHVPPVGCAAIEYRDVATRRKDFTSFYRLLPWDHAPGTLLVREAGGEVRFLDGTPYRVDGRDDLVLAVARRDDWDAVARDIFGAGV